MITGFNIYSVEGRVESVEQLALQRFPKINVNLEDVKADNENISVKYSFVADYFNGDSQNSKSVGQMKLSGEVELKESKDNVEKIKKKWGEQHILPTELAEEVMNGSNFRCSATGTLVAYSLGLIPPLGISQIKIQEQ